MKNKVCYVLIWSWATSHIANWFYGGTPISSWYQSGLSSCEAKRPHAFHVTQLLSTCRLENPPHVCHMCGSTRQCKQHKSLFSRKKIKKDACFVSKLYRTDDSSRAARYASGSGNGK
ncbi:hypothetical protein DVH24_006146 [Malus domestica]|uniref:Uncharacterized protein n=1 Tax=Malus domestica TaxID=3750 RepID=A0A498KUS9_MALDO|nr:hypothetical protein DVH24_006146 [Malus domestica]